jgi:hypothetical protein
MNVVREVRTVDIADAVRTVNPAATTGAMRSAAALRPVRIVRGVALARLLLATTVAVRPRATARAVGGQDGSPRVWVVRVLAVRIMAESALSLLRPRRTVVWGSAAVDAVHGMSMLLAATAWPVDRRAALSSAGEALSAAAFGGWAGRRVA